MLYHLFLVINGIVYHMLYLARINKAAYLFEGNFILQGLLLFIKEL